MSVLLVEDSSADAELIRRQLKAGFGDVEMYRADSAESLEVALGGASWDVVLSDFHMPGFNALDALDLVKQHDRYLPFIMVSGTIGEAIAVEIMKQGADDCIMKDNLARLVPAIKREITSSQIRRDHQRAELILRESERRFRHMLADVELVSMMLDRDGRITYCNDYLLRLTGWERENVIGQSWYGLFVAQELEDFQRDFKGLLAEDPDQSHNENEIVTRSGQHCLIRWNNSTLRSADGQIIGIASIGENITEVRRQKEALDHAHKRLHALTQRLIKLQEVERRALAADLHDYVGQSLSALSINLSMLESKTPPGSEQMTAILDDSRTLVEGIGRAIWQIISDLRPEALEESGLLKALRSSAEKFEQRTSTVTEVTGSRERLPIEVEAALLRVAQEAMSNTSKHAGAKHMNIHLRIKRSGVALWIEDDGHGFDPALLNLPRKRSRWGLMMMRERIESLGGRLRIRSAPGKGTQICVAWRQPR